MQYCIKKYAEISIKFRTFIKYNYLKIAVQTAHMTIVIKKKYFIYLLSYNNSLAIEKLFNFINTLYKWGLVHAAMRSLPM